MEVGRIDLPPQDRIQQVFLRASEDVRRIVETPRVEAAEAVLLEQKPDVLICRTENGTPCAIDRAIVGAMFWSKDQQEVAHLVVLSRESVSIATFTDAQALVAWKWFLGDDMVTIPDDIPVVKPRQQAPPPDAPTEPAQE